MAMTRMKHSDLGDFPLDGLLMHVPEFDSSSE